MRLLLIIVLVCVHTRLAAPEDTDPGDPARCDWGKDTVISGMTALVLGGTGAIGQQLVEQLLASDQWSKVVTVGRRAVQLFGDQPGASKLQQVVVDMDNLKNAAAAAFNGVDAVFCALGTTRADAGSAEVFKKVDHGYVAAAAAAAKAAGVPWFGLVSAQGANPNLPANDWRLCHGLLYSKTKGLAEESVKSSGFSRTAIFRPGLLDRGDKARSLEKLLSPLIGPLLGSIAVADVAKVMIADAAAFRAGSVSGLGVFEMKALQQAAAAGTAPHSSS